MILTKITSLKDNEVIPPSWYTITVDNGKVHVEFGKEYRAKYSEKDHWAIELEYDLVRSDN